MSADEGLHIVQLALCNPCLDGEGGECHTPGCAMWINRAPDLPLRDKVTFVADARVVLAEIDHERARQDEKWGEQNHPDGTTSEGMPLYGFSDTNLDLRTGDDLDSIFRERCDYLHKTGNGSWRDILLEEVFEAIGQPDPAKLRTELVQVAAVAVAWVEAIDRRQP